MKIAGFNETNPLAEKIANTILKSVLKYGKHPSVTAIRNLNIRSHFEIKKLNPRKAAQSTNVPVNILKDNADIFADYICEFFNESLNCCKFPNILKNANVTSVFEKGYRGSKEKYRPVSILPVMSKISEKLLCKQFAVFAYQNLSKYYFGFGKGFSTQYFLVAMLERWKGAVDDKKVFGAHLTDLSKTFNCLSHELIIAKLNAYGFSLPALNLIHDYFI